MTGSEMREIRRKLRLERLEMARLIGYTGTDRNDAMRVKRMENAGDPVPRHIARLVWLIHVWFNRTGEFPPFPAWDYYEFDHSPDPGHDKRERA